MEVDAVSLQRIQGAIAELLTAIETTLDEEHKEVLECLRRAGTILNQSAQPQPPRPAPPRGGLAPRQVRDVRTFIDTNLESPLTTKDLASAANLSTFYFCKMFKKATGFTFTQYLSHVRISKAKNLLLNPNLRISPPSPRSRLRNRREPSMVHQLIGCGNRSKEVNANRIATLQRYVSFSAKGSRYFTPLPLR